MGTGKKKKHKSLLLSANRRREAIPEPAVPGHTPLIQLSSKAGRTLIREIHVLQKRRKQALQNGDLATAAEIDEEITQAGGLERYQQASLNGQSRKRGGDSSHVLLSWLSLPKIKPSDFKQLTVLEIGALSPENAISQSTWLDVTRIDLHSTHPAIQEQDFMQRPIPTSAAEKFHLISCSLVLNFVPTPEDRGMMLRRFSAFLITPPSDATTSVPELGRILPCVFIVLPAPCLLNSRYLDQAHFLKIMESLGYNLLQEKISSKLIYQLWRWNGKADCGNVKWKKEEVNPGKSRNNFAVVLK